MNIPDNPLLLINKNNQISGVKILNDINDISWIQGLRLQALHCHEYRQRSYALMHSRQCCNVFTYITKISTHEFACWTVANFMNITLHIVALSRHALVIVCDMYM